MNLDKINDKIIICTDISAGVVPTDPVMRQCGKRRTLHGTACANSERVVGYFAVRDGNK